MKYADLMALPEAEREEALAKEINKRNEENKSLRDRLKKDNPKALQVFEALKARFGAEDIDEAFLDELASKVNGSMSTTEKLKVAEKMLEAERREKASLSEKLTKSEMLSKEKERDSMIYDAISKIGVRSESMTDAKKLFTIDAVYDGDSNKWIFDGKDLATYSAEFAKSRQYMIGNPVKAGSSNSSGSSSSHPTGSEGFLSEEDYMKMTPEQQRTPEVRKLVALSVDKWTPVS